MIEMAIDDGLMNDSPCLNAKLGEHSAGLSIFGVPIDGYGWLASIGGNAMEKFERNEQAMSHDAGQPQNESAIGSTSSKECDQAAGEGAKAANQKAKEEGRPTRATEWIGQMVGAEQAVD